MGNRMNKDLTVKDIAPYIGSGQYLEIRIFNPDHEGKCLLYEYLSIDTDVSELCKPYEDKEVFLIYTDTQSLSSVLVIEVEE